MPPSGKSNANWAQTLARIASSVVTIQIDATRAFDTEWNSTGQATGFVIDAKRGLILTNRHVVTPGPVTAQAIFQNREEVELLPVYRDPVHDFGIYRYDPAKLRFIQPAELPLYPAGAVIGRVTETGRLVLRMNGAVVADMLPYMLKNWFGVTSDTTGDTSSAASVGSSAIDWFRSAMARLN